MQYNDYPSLPTLPHNSLEYEMLFGHPRVLADKLHSCRTVCEQNLTLENFPLYKQLTQLPPALDARVLPAGVDGVPYG